MEQEQEQEQLECFQFSELLYPSAHTIQRLRHVCITCGFFTIAAHPVPRSLLRNARDASVRFFQLPEQLKQRFAHHKQSVTPQSCRGYNNHEMLNKQDADSGKQCFDLGVEKTPVEHDAPFCGLTLLPSDSEAPRFAASLLELQQAVLGSLVPVVSRALALAMQQKADFFDAYLRELTLIQRVIYYRRHASAGRHTDNGLFTLLFHDETRRDERASLQVYTRGKWMDVPGRRDELVVNLGDTLQLWSGGQFVSTPHRVLHRGQRDRISLPFFVYPDIRSAFVPLRAEQQPAQQPPPPPPRKVHVKDVMLNNFSNIWVRGTGAGRALQLT